MHEPSMKVTSLATALDGGFIRNRVKLPQSDVLEGSRVPGPVCCTACMKPEGGHFERYLYL